MVETMAQGHNRPKSNMSPGSIPLSCIVYTSLLLVFKIDRCTCSSVLDLGKFGPSWTCSSSLDLCTSWPLSCNVGSPIFWMCHWYIHVTYGLYRPVNMLPCIQLIFFLFRNRRTRKREEKGFYHKLYSKAILVYDCSFWSHMHEFHSEFELQHVKNCNFYPFINHF